MSTQDSKENLKFQGNWMQALPFNYGENDADYYVKNPNPVFTRKFNLRAVNQTKIFIAVLGFYIIYINNQRVGNFELNSDWTDYSKRIYYDSFNVTKYLSAGINEIRIELGNGMYNPSPLKLFGKYNLRERLSIIGEPKFILNMISNRRLILSGDENWVVHQGKLVTNNLYLGEKLDNTQVDQEDSIPVLIPQRLQDKKIFYPSFIPKIRKKEKVYPTVMRKISGGLLIDFGLVISGFFSIQIEGKNKQKVVMSYSELMTEEGLQYTTSYAGNIGSIPGVEGGPGAPQEALQQDVIICQEGANNFQNEFCYHSFRYVYIQGCALDQIKDCAAYFVHTDLQTIGSVHTDNEYLNKLYSAGVRTKLNNVHSIFEDCARERLGYGGDIVALANSNLYLFDLDSFFKKILDDFVIEQTPEGGITETAPYMGIKTKGVGHGSGPLLWQFVLPYVVFKHYQFYGNLDLVEKMFPAIKKQLDFLLKQNMDDLARCCIGDHGSILVENFRDETPDKLFVGYCTILLFVEASIKITKMLGKKNVDLLAKKAKIRKEIIKKFQNDDGSFGNGTQTSYAFALKLHLGNPKKVLKGLLSQINKDEGIFTTGIFGMPLLYSVLHHYHKDHIVYDWLTLNGKIGFKQMLSNGNGVLSELFRGKYYSANHAMFSSYIQWYFQALGGIDITTDSQACSKISLHPYFAKELNHVKTSLNTKRGLIVTNWDRKGRIIKFEAKIPERIKVIDIDPACKEKQLSILKEREGIIKITYEE